ncbi:siderophore iron transporter [Penicillium argentinense]|uniref:Siderophore iron transporter n=1 Tax=Penicillium argentinense TaxID=1131581 RepID=A0A9W9KLZ9_9EURO|nr:siderophore iron transporter [Penicillium argentinense]KAJ5110446.1 siderophore iron transporter [Penicillium argentinense]
MSPKDKITPTTSDEMNLTKFKVGDAHLSQGVSRMEAVHREAKKNRKLLWLVAISVLQHSSILSTLSIATSIISAVSKPFIATIPNIASRPYTYILTFWFYVIGYVIAASSKTISTYIVGEIFVAIGSSGPNLTYDIIVADLTPLEWRGFAGSTLSTRVIINT